ncbi:flagellar hook-length control protein FliK [Ferruginivarius sediminum]|uniref:Flagellar hook-length control protein FliK n=1 Tax=Ferruginivarius sediminum TaxID=2661937 RepID=A0A369TEA6_9PROT|nr:flagellar hook-length control protein FliK [Ferruginivarius sediminum]RDD63643.1 flagellar hook-length control protein FliK [Ferruginivarius sediminum]
MAQPIPVATEPTARASEPRRAKQDSGEDNGFASMLAQSNRSSDKAPKQDTAGKASASESDTARDSQDKAGRDAQRSAQDRNAAKAGAAKGDQRGEVEQKAQAANRPGKEGSKQPTALSALADADAARDSKAADSKVAQSAAAETTATRKQAAENLRNAQATRAANDGKTRATGTQAEAAKASDANDRGTGAAANNARFSAQRVSVSVTQPGTTTPATTPLSGETAIAAQFAANAEAGRVEGGTGANKSARGERQGQAGQARRDMTAGQADAASQVKASQTQQPERVNPVQQMQAEATAARHVSETPPTSTSAQSGDAQATAGAASTTNQGFDPVLQGTHGTTPGIQGAEAAGRAAEAQAPNHARTPAPLPVQEQVAVQIQRAAGQGQQRLNIRLHPAELGRIEVKLDVGDDGAVRAVLAVDKAETLDMLQRDTRGLEKALQNAGLKTDGGSLSFNLRGEQGGQDQFGNGGGNHHHGTSPAGLGSEEGSVPETVADVPPSLRLSDDGLDIRV